MAPTFGSGSIGDVLDTGTEQGGVSAQQRDEGSRRSLGRLRLHQSTHLYSIRKGGRRSELRRSRGRHR
jgi:hypothetical protein